MKMNTSVLQKFEQENVLKSLKIINLIFYLFKDKVIADLLQKSV